MRTLILTTCIATILLSSCKKEEISNQEEEDIVFCEIIPSAIMPGETTSALHHVDFSPDLVISSYNTQTTHDIDIDNDGEIDFQFYVHSAFPMAGTAFGGTAIRIRTISDSAQVIVDDNQFADVLLPNDTISYGSNWASGEITLMYHGPDNTVGPPYTNYVSTGDWFGTSDAYIGIRLAPHRLGWLHISLPQTDPSTSSPLHFHDYAIIN